MNIVLVEPQIPPNTGNIARLCVATNSTLHIVRPIPFRMDDKTLKRSGCDYWEHLKLIFHNSLEEFLRYCEGNNVYFFSTKVSRLYTSVKYTKDDYLVFGPETSGLPADLLKRYSEQSLTIPMPGATRSLNLSTSVGIVLYEALRQINEW